MEYTAEDGGDGKRALRVGLMQVRGLRVETITTILRARGESGKFPSLEDFLRRVPVERDEIESLIKCGAFDEMNDAAGRMTRPAMLWRWNFLQAGGKNALPGAAALPESVKTLFVTANPQNAIDAALAEMQTPEDTIEQKLKYEREILEVCVSAHPLHFLPPTAEASTDELPRLPH